MSWETLVGVKTCEGNRAMLRSLEKHLQFRGSFLAVFFRQIGVILRSSRLSYANGRASLALQLRELPWIRSRDIALESLDGLRLT
jgi:hypothetical protein